MWDFVHKPTILQHTFVPKAVEQMVWITDVMSLVVFPVKGHWFLRHTAGEEMFHTLIWLQFLTLHNQSLHLAICKWLWYGLTAVYIFSTKFINFTILSNCPFLGNNQCQKL